MKLFFINLMLFFCFIGYDSFSYDLALYQPDQIAQTQNSFQLVFISLNYSDKTVFDSDASFFAERINTTRPFDEYHARITIYRAYLSQEEQITLCKETDSFPYRGVRSDFLETLAARLNSPYKLVIMDATSSLSCADLSSVNEFSMIIVGRKRYEDMEQLARGFLHELGHSLGLRDERIGHCPDCAVSFPNCARNQAEAESWWGDLIEPGGRVGFIEGRCGNYRYLRPTIASLMNNPNKARDYGPVNERFLKEAFRDYLVQ